MPQIGGLARRYLHTFDRASQVFYSIFMLDTQVTIKCETSENKTGPLKPRTKT